jgi:hypothetical protein
VSEWNEYRLDLSKVDHQTKRYSRSFPYPLLYMIPKNTVPYIGHMFLYVEPHPDYEYIIDTTAENPNIVIIKWRKINDNPRTDNR